MIRFYSASSSALLKPWVFVNSLDSARRFQIATVPYPVSNLTLNALDSTSGRTSIRRWKRSRLVWSLAAIIVLVVGGSGLRIGLVYYRQQSAIAEIRRVNGRIATVPIGQPRLRQFVGEDHLQGFDDVVELRLSDAFFTDEEAEHLKCLTRLQYLDLNGTRVTDAGVSNIKDLTRLKWLQLNDTQITDAGLTHLKALGQLRFLNLLGTNVTDAGLENLKGLTSLEDLWLGRTGVSEAGLRSLKGLANLRVVWLDETRVTDAGIAEFKATLPLVKIYR